MAVKSLTSVSNHRNHAHFLKMDTYSNNIPFSFSNRIYDHQMKIATWLFIDDPLIQIAQAPIQGLEARLAISLHVFADCHKD